MSPLEKILSLIFVSSETKEHENKSLPGRFSIQLPYPFRLREN